MKVLPRVVCRLATIFVALAAGSVQAGPLLVAGSPTYDQTGLKDGNVPYAPGWGVNNSGTAVGYALKYGFSTTDSRAVRWDASGTAATELGNLGTGPSGYTRAYAVNDAGTAVGFTRGDSYTGSRAVRWDASGTAATELGNLGTDGSGGTWAFANAVNAGGTAVGCARKYVSGSFKGDRAVRWDASGMATELGSLGTDGSGYTYVYALAINAGGVTVGYSRKYDGDNDMGHRAVRWDASGTAATELGDLGTDGSGDTDAAAYAVNNAGMVVGYARKYDSGSNKGNRAVRWDASGTAATELDNLGTDASGVAYAKAFAVNAGGTAVGYAQKYDSGSYKGHRAVRWDASGTAATELGNLGTNASGSTTAQAYAVNDAGTAVGYAQKYVNGSLIGERAVIWLPDASAIDLNDLGVAPVPEGGSWTLTTAKAISADGWVAGEGMYPYGEGSYAYGRLWVAQVGLGGAWTNATGGTWGRGPNWSTGTPAMQVGNATFNLDSNYAVALDRDELTKTIAVNAGTVTIDFNGHTLTTESGLSIADGATFKGAGTIFGDILNAGAILPGNSSGVLNLTGNLVNTGLLEFEIAGYADYDQINLTGAFSAGGTIAVWLDGYAPMSGELFDLMDFASFVDNGYTFDLSQAALSDGLAWDTTAFATTGSISVVPEPGSIVLLGIGVMGLLAYACRQRRVTRQVGHNPTKILRLR